MSKTKCTQLLMDEHKTILRALTILEAMGRQAEAGFMPAEADIESILEFLKSFADDLHQGKEEAILFPIFSKACSKSDLPAVSHLVFEHNQERSLIEGLQDALLTSSGPDFAYYANRLRAILSNHIYKEDHILFERVDEILSSEDDARVVAGFGEMDATIKTTRRASLMKNLRALEWKYIGKAAHAGSVI